MDAFAQFEAQLHAVLNHLYDSVYRPPVLLCRVLELQDEPTIDRARHAIAAAIDRMKPTPDMPSSARAARIYELLSSRYLYERTQKETAQRLNITPRHLRREQQDAIFALAQHLWQTSHTRTMDTPAMHTTAWREQIQQELIALQKQAPGLVADVGEALQGVAELAHALATARGVQLQVQAIQPRQMVQAHPSVLRQTLLTAVVSLLQNMSHGVLALEAECRTTHILITVTGEPVSALEPRPNAFIQEIMANVNGTYTVAQQGNQISIALEFMAAQPASVLVIDDNADLGHFYSRYLAGTRFSMTQSLDAQHALASLASRTPDVIVLDVMLPDRDGWNLLTQLRREPGCGDIPIIVCSVVGHTELAHSLGAAFYLPKPVHRLDFVHALDQVLGRHQ